MLALHGRESGLGLDDRVVRRGIAHRPVEAEAGDPGIDQAGMQCPQMELADDAIPLPLLDPARDRTVVLLGHERHGIADEAWPLIDDVVQIPMIGRGASLNVAVAGSLVLYRLAGLA
ncbi:MAG: TrmH family RNA methyltransferase [Acidimicrobiales bacterium]